MQSILSYVLAVRVFTAPLRLERAESHFKGQLTVTPLFSHALFSRLNYNTGSQHSNDLFLSLFPILQQFLMLKDHILFFSVFLCLAYCQCSINMSCMDGLTQYFKNIFLIHQRELIKHFTYSQYSLKYSFSLIFLGVRFISMTTLK